MIHLRSSVLKGAVHPENARDLWPALQHAVELEHSVIPVYLYALYSLDPSVNAEIAEILQSVVTEEMLHMALASNVLNALGGSPSIDRPGFIPKYPGPLPGGVQSELTVNLAPFSMTQLDAFLQIEEPTKPIDYRSAAPGKTKPRGITIDQFYDTIKKGIRSLGDDAFVKPPRNQVGPNLLPESVVVHNVETAQEAITTITDQGEGTRKSPLEIVGKGYAHYYRYMQIKKGNLLVPTPKPNLPADQQYAYIGDPVPFQSSGVYAVPTNPLAKNYPPGSLHAISNNNFNYTYTSLLSVLHAMFNGANTPDQFRRAIGLMMSLEEQAIAMMSGLVCPGDFIGPSFEYQPVNP